MIKENDLFLFTDEAGNIEPGNTRGFGLYTRDTRYLSRLELTLAGAKPVLLSSSAEDNHESTIRLTNPHIERDGKLVLWRESVEVLRRRFIHEGVLFETLAYTNYSPKPISFETALTFDADFADMFVVRGFLSGRLGAKEGSRIAADRMEIAYRGADDVRRTTVITWDREPSWAGPDGTVAFQLALEPRETITIHFTVTPVENGDMPPACDPDQARRKLRASYEQWAEETTEVESDLPQFDKLYARGLNDLRALLTDLGHGRFPVAGLPWFAVPFGRDSLIAALQLLPANPDVALGTLQTMAAYQGVKTDAWRDETPGKIMHEIRYGELANTNQVPFTPYYGSVDATPLFLVLAAEYYDWTGDLESIRRLLPSFEQALAWIDCYGDLDGDGFVEYHAASSKGIGNQGWKDSADSIVHDSGDYAESPIALVEVQGYVYQAKTGMAAIYRALGNDAAADRLEREAAELKQRFEERFWMDDEQFYAIALDRDKRQVRSVTSNPGHLLMTGLPAADRAAAVARRLADEDLFSGYGIRTMSEHSAGFNPMSYHNGSVWPHDNSLCLIGLSRLGFEAQSRQVIDGLMKAAEHFAYARLPELFCGFRDTLGAPVPYPVACSPQAWAAGTPIVFLQAALGIRPNAAAKTITLRPMLPDGMNRLHVRRLRAGGGRLTLTIERDGQNAVPRVKVEHNSTGYALHVLNAIEQQLQEG